MTTKDDFDVSISVSATLGLYATILQGMEPAIDRVLAIVDEREEEVPDNLAVPIMRDVLLAAKAFVAAHKKYQQVANMMMTGGMQQEPPDKVQ